MFALGKKYTGTIARRLKNLKVAGKDVKQKSPNVHAKVAAATKLVVMIVFSAGGQTCLVLCCARPVNRPELVPEIVKCSRSLDICAQG